MQLIFKIFAYVFSRQNFIHICQDRWFDPTCQNNIKNMFDQTNLEKIAQADNYQQLLSQELQEPNKKTVLVGHCFRKQIEGQLVSDFRMMNHQYKAEMYDQLAKKLKSQDPLVQHEGIIGIRKLLNQEDLSLFFQYVNVRDHVKKHLIDKCFQLMRQNQYLHLKYEACYALTNLANDEEFCGLIVAKKGVQLFIALMKEQNQIMIQNLAVLALGNIAADSRAHRDTILQNGGVRFLIEKIKKATTRAQLTDAVWAISNICRTKPFKNFQEINQVCQILCEVLKSSVFLEHDEDFVGILWALCKLIKKERGQIQLVRKWGILNMLLQLMVDDKSKRFCTPILEIIDIFSTGNEVQIEELVNNKLFFQAALTLASHPDSAIRQKICWILSNIAEGSQKLALTLFSQQTLLKNLSHLIWSQQQRDVCGVCQIYAGLALNAPQSKIRLIQLILSQKIPQAITKLLQSRQISILRDSLRILGILLQFGQQCQINEHNPILATFLQRTVAQAILNWLIDHQDGKVSGSAVRIILCYFAGR